MNITIIVEHLLYIVNIDFNMALYAVAIR